MNYSSLYDLIVSIERGTKLHISVAFFGVKRTEEMQLPYDATIHTSDYCWKIKEYSNMAKKCYRCKYLTLNKAIKEKKPFYGTCIHGISEYINPVFLNGNLICIIFIGNIYDKESGDKKITDSLEKIGFSSHTDFFIKTMEEKEDTSIYENYAKLIESYIKMLLLYSEKSKENSKNPLINDILNFIDDNLFGDIKIKKLAELFHYNEKYIGRIFKKEMGFSITQYVLNRRIDSAVSEIKSSNDSIISISTKNGFENVTYFNRKFKEKFGISPSEYRKRN